MKSKPVYFEGHMSAETTGEAEREFPLKISIKTT